MRHAKPFQMISSIQLTCSIYIYSFAIIAFMHVSFFVHDGIGLSTTSVETLQFSTYFLFIRKQDFRLKGGEEIMMSKALGPSLFFLGRDCEWLPCLEGQNRQLPIASVQRTRSTLAGHSAIPRGTDVARMNTNRAIQIAAQRTQGL